MSNENMIVRKIIFEGNFSTYVFGKCLSSALSPAESDCWTSRHLFYEKKKIKSFRLCGGCILVEKWNAYEAHIFRGILIGNEVFVFKYPVMCNQIIYNFSLFSLKCR